MSFQNFNYEKHPLILRGISVRHTYGKIGCYTDPHHDQIISTCNPTKADLKLQFQFPTCNPTKAVLTPRTAE